MAKGFKYNTLAPMIEVELYRIWCDGNHNWVADYTLGGLFRNRGVVVKDDDVRRVASDMAKENPPKLRKLPRNSMYKWRGATDSNLGWVYA